MISYRRADSGAIAGRIFDRLTAHYGREAVFRDVDSIPLSVDFRQHLAETLRQSDIVLVIVGPHWLGKDRRSRVNDVNDPVRVEVETALATGAMIIPIFVEAAVMPDPAQLPETMRDFTYRNGQRVDSGQDFDHHMQRLLRNMDGLLERRAPPKIDPSPRAILSAEAIEKGRTLARRAFAFARHATSKATAAATTSDALQSINPLRSLRWHSGLILSIGFSPDSATLASASMDRTAKLWDVASGQMLLSLTREPRCVALAVAYSPDGSSLAVGSEDGTLTLFEPATGRPIKTLNGYPGIGHGITFSKNGRMLRAAAARVVKLWDLEHDEETVQPAATSSETVPQLREDDGSFAAIGKFANRLLDKANDFKLRALYFTSGQAMATSLDERITATASELAVTLRETETPQAVRAISGTWGLGTRLAFSPDAAILAVGAWAQQVRLWDVRSGAVVAILGPASSSPWAIAFSPDGRLFAAAAGDGAINLWDITPLGQAGAPAAPEAGDP